MTDRTQQDERDKRKAKNICASRQCTHARVCGKLSSIMSVDRNLDEVVCVVEDCILVL